MSKLSFEAGEGTGVHWPDHAYTPGKNDRHPEDFFDEIKNSVSTGMTANEISQSRAYLFGFELFDQGFYWEAHEVWEPVWLALPDSAQEKFFVQALIQTSNAYLKLRMEKPKAALRLCGIAREILCKCQKQKVMGCEQGAVLSVIDDVEREIKLTL